MRLKFEAGPPPGSAGSTSCCLLQCFCVVADTGWFARYCSSCWLWFVPGFLLRPPSPRDIILLDDELIDVKLSSATLGDYCGCFAWLSSLPRPHPLSVPYWLCPKPPGDMPLVALLPGENKLYLVEDAKLICVSLIGSTVCDYGLAAEYCNYRCWAAWSPATTPTLCCFPMSKMLFPCLCCYSCSMIAFLSGVFRLTESSLPTVWSRSL